MTYEQFADALVATQILSDPWLGGRERFRLRGVVLEPHRARALADAAERVAAVHEELAQIVWQRPELLEGYFQLTPWQKLMWLSSQGAWHGIARADLFFCDDGQVRCCELNSDTPSGEAEAVLVNALLREAHGAVLDPNVGLRDRFLAMLRESAAACDRPLERVGIVYPTELTEDLSMIALYRHWLEEAGLEVVLGSPFNLGPGPKERPVALLGQPVDAILRHYKTDWWGEREPALLDEADFDDPTPLEGPLELMLQAAHRSELTIVNPFGAVITQNKLGLAFMHEEHALFSPTARRAIEELIPETRRLCKLDRERLRAEKDLWVLKSDFGCEGSETLCGRYASTKEWERVLDAAIPERWVAQRFFEVAPEGDGLLPNFGAYVVGGRAAGFFTRLSSGPTDYGSVTVPTYLQQATQDTQHREQA